MTSYFTGCSSVSVSTLIACIFFQIPNDVSESNMVCSSVTSYRFDHENVAIRDTHTSIFTGSVTSYENNLLWVELKFNFSIEVNNCN